MFGHIDMTPSDLVMAFALAMTLQRMQRSAAQQDGGPGALGAKPPRAESQRRRRGGRQQGQQKPARPWPWPNFARRRQQAQQDAEERQQRRRQGEREGAAGGGAAAPPPPLQRRSGRSMQLSEQSSPEARDSAASAANGDSTNGGGGGGNGVGVPRSYSPQSTDALLSYGSSDPLLLAASRRLAASAAASSGSGRGGAEGEAALEVLPESDPGTPGGSVQSEGQEVGMRWGAASPPTSPRADVERALGLLGRPPQGDEAHAAGAAAGELHTGSAAVNGGGGGGAVGAADAPRYLGWSASEQRRFGEELHHHASFMPARLVRDNLAMGATKTSEAEEQGLPGKQ